MARADDEVVPVMSHDDETRPAAKRVPAASGKTATRAASGKSAARTPGRKRMPATGAAVVAARAAAAFARAAELREAQERAFADAMAALRFTGDGARGLTFERRWTRPGVHPYDEIAWEIRTAAIGNESGKLVFEQKDVEVPASWSQLATNVVVSKYFRGHLGTPERETQRPAAHRPGRPLHLRLGARPSTTSPRTRTSPRSARS